MIVQPYKSGGRALTALIAKYNGKKNFNHDIYTNSFKTYISPVMLYGSEACGYYKLKKCDKIQYRAMRFFFGVHKSHHIIIFFQHKEYVVIKFKIKQNIQGL